MQAIFDARIAAIRSLRNDPASPLEEGLFDVPAFSGADAVVTGAALVSARAQRPVDLPTNSSRQVGATLQYWAIDESRASRAMPAFTDHGEVLFVNILDPRHIELDPRHIEAVLRQASSRFGRVAVAGTPEFLAECRRVAAEMRLTIDVGERHLAPSSRASRDVGWRRRPVTRVRTSRRSLACARRSTHAGFVVTIRGWRSSGEQPCHGVSWTVTVPDWSRGEVRLALRLDQLLQDSDAFNEPRQFSIAHLVMW